MSFRNLYQLLCLLLVFPASAKELYFQHVDLNDGFTQPSAISIYEDARGYIWFGNDNFNVYDGRIVRSFRLSTYMDGVEDNNIHAICGDGEAFVYMLANNRVIVYNMRTEEFQRTDILANTLTYENQYLYYSSKNTLYRYPLDGEPEELYAFQDSTITIRSLLLSDAGWLLGTNKGLYEYTGGTVRSLLENESISSLFKDAQNRLWIGTGSNGVRVYNDGTWIALQENGPVCPLVNNQVRCINQDIKGNIWIGSFGGITVVKPSLQDYYHLSHKEQVSWSLQHSSVYAIHRDSQGGMWVGTYYGGLSYFNPDTENYTFYGISPSDPHSLNGFLFGKMTEDTKGNLYIATEHGGLNSMDLKTQKIKRFDSGPSRIPCRTTKSVWYDADRDRLYVGTFLRGLLCSTSSGPFEQIGADVLVEDHQQIITDLIPWKGNLIVVSQGGIYLLDLETQKLSWLFTDPDLLSQTGVIIRAAYLDMEDRLWLAPANREILCVNMDTRKVEDILSVKGMIGKKPVQSITGDNRGNLYFVVVGMGVLQYEPLNDFWACYNQEQGQLLTNEPFKVCVTPMGRLLITSIRGITLLDMKRGKSTHTLLGTSSPLHRLNSNCGVYISPKDSTIFIGGVEGIIATKESGLAATTVPYTISFNSLYVDNTLMTPSSASTPLKEGIAYTSELTLPYDRNNLTIGFTSTNYRYADKNLFEYKLEGLDKQWTRTRHPLIIYTSLSPGKYRLLVREVGEGKQISMDIRIRPPFYASVYAFGIYILLTVLFLVWLIRFNRSRAVLKASLEMEHREKLRIEKLNLMKLKFYINISHELRTPLTLMVSQIDLILQNYDLGGTFRNKLLKVRQYTGQMQQLITEVLDFRRLEQGKMPFHASKQNLVSFIQQIFDSFRDYASMNHIQYKLEVADENIPVWFDPVQIRKVFNNLLSNAFKFTPKEGNITITIIQKKDIAEIRISDTGSGIPQSQQDHIFERFYQADNASGVSLSGSGIGLALTREIILQHKGTIEVRSALGKGTTFIVTLKLGEQHLTEEQKTTEAAAVDILPVETLRPEEEIVFSDSLDNPSPEIKENALSVLIVEDNEDLLQVLEEAFSIKYKVYKASEGEEGIRIAEEMQPDLIISDVMMPGMSGTAMCQRLKKKFETSHIPILLLTARTDLESALEGMKCGASDYIMKPFNLELLLLKCNNVIATLRRQQTRFCTEAESAPTDLATNRLDQQLLEDSVRIIEENMENKDFNIDMWCRQIAIGRTRLGGKIKAVTGLTLNDFILQIKLRKCASLLENSELTISEITWKAGFSSPGYMGKCFKEYFGVTPMQYRNGKNKSRSE